MRLGHAMSYLAGSYFESGEQINYAVALVIVRVARGSARTQGQRQLSSLQGLDRGFLVNAQHDRMLGRIQIQADDVMHLRDELWVAADLIRPNEVRLQTILSKNVGHTSTREAHLLREQARGPSAAPRWWRR